MSRPERIPHLTVNTQAQNLTEAEREYEHAASIHILSVGQSNIQHPPKIIGCGHSNRTHFECIDLDTFELLPREMRRRRFRIGPNHHAYLNLRAKHKAKPIENTYVLADNVSHFGVALDN